jgi:hypothetical protein
MHVWFHFNVSGTNKLLVSVPETLRVNYKRDEYNNRFFTRSILVLATTEQSLTKLYRDVTFWVVTLVLMSGPYSLAVLTRLANYAKFSVHLKRGSHIDGLVKLI